MLKKIYKLTALEIKNLFKKDTPFRVKIIRGVFFDIKIFYNIPNIDFSKAAIVASGKVFKKAVERNKIRRQIYSILEKFIQENKKNNSLKDKKIFLLIYPKKEIKNIKFLDFQKEVYNTLNNLNTQTHV